MLLILINYEIIFVGTSSHASSTASSPASSPASSFLLLRGLGGGGGEGVGVEGDLLVHYYS